MDEAAVLRLTAGDPVRANVAERVQAALTLTRRGYSARATAERLRVTERTVCRYRSRTRAA